MTAGPIVAPLPFRQPNRRRRDEVCEINPATLVGGDYFDEIQDLYARIRCRDTDPAYADAPVLDGYVRISINPSTGETEKTDRQARDVLRSMIDRRCRLGRLLRDDNMSAWQKNGKRPGWNLTLSRVERGIVNGVYVPHIDRYLRQPRQLERLIDASDKGSLIWSQYGEFDLGTSMGRFIARQMVSQAAMQSDETSRRAMSRFAARREQGKRHGTIRPFGVYGTVRGVEVDRRYVDRERDAIVWAVDELLGNASATLAGIAREWNRRGLRTTRTGKMFAYNDVRQILERPYLCGLLHHGTEIIGVIKDFEPIIDRRRWDLVQSMLQGRKRGRPQGSGNYPLSFGVLRGECGCTLAGKLSSGSRRYACPHTTIRADETEAAVKAAVLGVLTAPDRPEVVARRTRRLTDAQGRLTAAEAALRTVAEQFSAGSLSLDEWQIVRAPLAEAAEAARHNLSALELSGGALPIHETDADLIERWDNGEAAALTRAAFAAIVIRRAVSNREPAAGRIRFEPFD